MNSLKLNKITLTLCAIIVGLVIYLFMIEPEIIEIKIPSKEGKKIIESPEPEIRVDTIYKTIFKDGKTKTVKEVVQVKNPINKELLQKYEAAVKIKDSILRDKIFKEAIQERLYIETLKDSVQTITVKSEVVGTLKRQVISYKTNPQTIKIKNKNRPSVYVGAFSYIPTVQGNSISVGLNLNVVNKNKVFTIGIDNVKNVFVGFSIKLF